MYRVLRYGKANYFADDEQVLWSYEPDDIEPAFVRMNSDLESIREWSVKHCLKLNVAKCTVIHIVPPNVLEVMKDNGLHVMLEDEPLEISVSVKTLGVMLDSELTLSDHVAYVIKKALGRLRGMYRLRTILPEAAKIQLVESMILSLLYYCFPAYGNSISKEDMNNIQKLQNTAVRFIYNLRRYDHVSTCREAAGFLPMEATCRLQTCCLINRVLANQEPQYLAERLPYRGDVAARSTRHDDLLHFPRVRLEVGRRGFSYFGPTLYNRLPGDLKRLRGNNFKKNLKRYLHDNALNV